MIPEEEQKFLVQNCLDFFYATVSEQRECLALFEDLKAIKGMSLENLLGEPEIRKVIDSARALSEKPRVRALLERLKQIRFPQSYEIQKQFREKVSRLKFKNKIQILKSESMEEEGIELKVKLPNRETLARVIEELREKQDEIEDLIG